MEKTISFDYGKNTIAIGYDIVNGPEEVAFTMLPAFNFRDHNNGSKIGELDFDKSVSGQEITLVPTNRKIRKLQQKYDIIITGKTYQIKKRRCNYDFLHKKAVRLCAK